MVLSPLTVTARRRSGSVIAGATTSVFLRGTQTAAALFADEGGSTARVLVDGSDGRLMPDFIDTPGCHMAERTLGQLGLSHG